MVNGHSESQFVKPKKISTYLPRKSDNLTVSPVWLVSEKSAAGCVGEIIDPENEGLFVLYQEYPRAIPTSTTSRAIAMIRYFLFIVFPSVFQLFNNGSNKVEGRIEEEPDHIHKMPVDHTGFDCPMFLGGIQSVQPIAQHNRQENNTGEHME